MMNETHRLILREINVDDNDTLYSVDDNDTLYSVLANSDIMQHYLLHPFIFKKDSGVRDILSLL